MEEVIRFFSEKEFIVTLATAIVTVIYSLTVSKFLKSSKIRTEKRKKNFFNILIKGLEKNTINNHKDLINIYKGATNLSTEDLSYRYGLNKWLRELLTLIISEDPEIKFNKDNLKMLTQKITEFIDNNEQVSPFSDLPETERNMLSDIGAFIKNDDKNSANRKIKELSSVIQTRNEEQKKLENQNKWAIPLAIIGVILTITFGLISIL